MTSERISTSSSMPGRAAEEDVDDFLEVEQPERQLDVARREHLRGFAEEAAVFVVRVDQEDAQVRARPLQLVQDDRDARGLADAGGAEHGKVPADQLGAVEVAADAGILLQVPDIDRARAGQLVDDAQVGVRHHRGAVADRGIVRDATLEARAAAAIAHDLAHQVELRGRDKALVDCVARDVDRDVGDQADEARRGAVDGKEFADGGAGVAGRRRIAPAASRSSPAIRSRRGRGRSLARSARLPTRRPASAPARPSRGATPRTAQRLREIDRGSRPPPHSCVARGREFFAPPAPWWVSFTPVSF